MIDNKALNIPSESDPSKTNPRTVGVGTDASPVDQSADQHPEEKPRVVLSEEVPSLAGN